MLRRAAIAGLVAAGCLVQPAAASAHAVLTHSTPHRDATVDVVPQRVQVDFNEPVGTSVGAVRVFDEQGERVDDVSLTRPKPESVAVDMPDELPPGLYTATYRVMSADGHPVSGGLVFGVRTAVRAGSTGPPVEELLRRQEAGPTVEALYGIARGLSYGALLLLIGAVVFRLLVWRAPGRWPGRLLLAAGLTGLLASAAAFPLQGLLATGLGLGALLDGPVLSASADANAGLASAIRAGLWLALLAALLPRRTWARGDTVVVAALVAGIVATLPWGGHAGTQEPGAVLVPADVAHVVGAGAWLGGLVCLLVAFWPRGAAPGDPGTAAATGAFSRLALASVVLLVVAGTVQAWWYLGSVGALVEGAYGIALLAKIALVAVVVALGARNRRLLLRPGGGGAQLRRIMRAEVGIAVLVLAATVVLVRAAPPVALAALPEERELVLGPMRMQMVAEPARVGSNAFHLYLFDRRTGAQIDRVDEMLMTLDHPGEGLNFRIPVGRKGPAHYEVLGQPLPAAGRWRIRVEVRVGDFDLYTARTTIEVDEP